MPPTPEKEKQEEAPRSWLSNLIRISSTSKSKRPAHTDDELSKTIPAFSSTDRGSMKPAAGSKRVDIDAANGVTFESTAPAFRSSATTAFDGADAPVGSSKDHAAKDAVADLVGAESDVALTSGQLDIAAAKDLTNTTKSSKEQKQKRTRKSHTRNETDAERKTKAGSVPEIEAIFEAEPEPESERGIESPLNHSLDTEMTEHINVSGSMERYIKNMEYGVILLGDVTEKKVDPRIEKKGKMNEKEKRLFDYVNTMLQTTPCTQAANEHSASTRRIYGYYIARMLKFMANLDYTPENFQINGSLMVKCLMEYEQEKSLNVEESFKNFRYACTLLNNLIAIYKTRDIPDFIDREMEKQKIANIPNVELVSKLINTRIAKHHENARENYHNKHRPEMNHKKYTDDNLAEMMINMYNMTGAERTSDKKYKYKIYDGINAVLEMLLGHHYLLSGDNKRVLELSDGLFTHEKTSRGKIPILGYKVPTGKTIRGSSTSKAVGCCRNKRPEICLVLAIALSAWFRFDFPKGPNSGSEFPDFLDKTDWYDLKVLFSTLSKGKSEVSYKWERELVLKCTESINYLSTKRTSVGRINRTQPADSHQISEEQIRRSSHWDTDALQKNDPHSYAHDFIMFSGGFESYESYYIHREQFKPPESLRRQIFPWLEDLQKQVTERDQSDLAPLERDDAIDVFLKTLQEFRDVILQDLTLMVDITRDSIFVKHPITKDPEFLAFKRTIEESNKTNTLMRSWRKTKDVLTYIVPSISDKFDMICNAINVLGSKIDTETTNIQGYMRSSQDSMSRMYAHLVAQDSRMDRVEVSNEQLREIVKEFVDGRFEVATENIQARLDELLTIQARLDELLTIQLQSMEGSELNQPAIESNQSANQSNQAASRAITTIARSRVTKRPSDTNLRRRPLKRLRSLQMPMKRDTNTVLELVEEWYVGRNNEMSVVQKNEIYGATWRHDHAINIFYKRRLVTIQALQKLLSMEEFKDMDRDDAAFLLEKYRLYHKHSLYSLGVCFQKRHIENTIKNFLEFIGLIDSGSLDPESIV